MHPSEQDCPEYHILLPRKFTDHKATRHMPQTRRTHSQPPSLFTNPLCLTVSYQLPVFPYPSALSIDFTIPVRDRRLYYTREHLPEELFMFLPAHSHPRLGHQISEGDRLRQFILA